jgi:hypothetical protein
LIAVRAVGTGAWYWLNPSAGVLNPFPLALGPEDGPIAISADGTMAAISQPDKGPVTMPINVAAPVASSSPTSSGPPPSSAGSLPHASPSSSTAVHHVNSRLPHPDALAWGPGAKEVVLAVSGEIQIYNATAADGTLPRGRYLASQNIIGIDWSEPLISQSLALVKPNRGPQAIVDALLNATKLPAAADSPEARPLTRVYIWPFDSSKSSPIAAITDPTAAVLQQYPPLPAGVVFHHWAASESWALLGGCIRYRVVITGSVTPTASTFGLGSNTPCNAPVLTPTPGPTAKGSPSK